MGVFAIMKAKENNIEIAGQSKRSAYQKRCVFRLFDQNIPEKALGNYAAYKQLRMFG